MFVNHPEKLANAEKIFEAFFITKATGMGPAISRSIIAAHEGRLWATPGSSRGTVVHVLLPFRTPQAGKGNARTLPPAKIERDRSVPVAEMIDASKAQRFHDRRKSSHTFRPSVRLGSRRLPHVYSDKMKFPSWPNRQEHGNLSE